jgi:diguanylate cyclase (GGDEF)-like protein
MPPVLHSEPIEISLTTLVEALDQIDVGIVLLDRDTNVRFANKRFAEIWCGPLELLATAPSFRVLLAHAAENFACHARSQTQFACLDRCEAGACAGTARAAAIDLNDGRRLLFCCKPCSDGGRILTYYDVTPLQEEPEQLRQVVARLNAEQRFTAETLEDQAAYLASLAETADENARQAKEANRRLTREIAGRRQLELQLRLMATTDALTGALNRRQFLTLGRRKLQDAHRRGTPVAVLMLDIDHFKSINDRYGHFVGDEGLKHVVALLRGAVRGNDLLGRLGGEEFAIVLADVERETAWQVAERLRGQLAATPLRHGENSITITASIGLTMMRSDDRTIEQLLTRADARLYVAKESGRNRVQVADAQVSA